MGSRIAWPDFSLTVCIDADGALPENKPFHFCGEVKQEVSPQVADSFTVDYDDPSIPPIRRALAPGEIPIIPQPQGGSFVVWFFSKNNVFVAPEGLGYKGTELSDSCLYPDAANTPIPGFESPGKVGYRRSSTTRPAGDYTRCLSVSRADGTYTEPVRHVIRVSY
jgi:hypothetical protein